MLRIRGLTKSYKTNSGDVQAVKEVDLDVGVGEIVTLLGPSGCGKTTTLRCVAGLEQPDSGEIEIDGQCVFSRPLRTNVPTHRRPIAIVFQSYAIWPHMNVFENVAYPLRVSRTRFTKAEVQNRVMDALDTVRIPDLAGRSATTLSGGQQQRVALARALVREPKLLLLDEPLSNLDARLREEMRLELKELFDRTGISALYVTHDHLEALVLSDRIVVMNAGAVAQQGMPRELFAQPKDEFVADFLGAGNLLPAVVQEVAAGSVRLDVGFTTLRCPAVAGVAAGAEVLVALRPEGLALSRTNSTEGVISLACRVEAEAFLGTAMEYRVGVGDHHLRVRMALEPDSFSPGEQAYLLISPESCIVVPTAAA